MGDCPRPYKDSATRCNVTQGDKKAERQRDSHIPHMGSNWHGLRQHIARKPHSTGIKPYVLCDNTHDYVIDVYLYTGRRGHICRTGTCAGDFDAKAIMRLWSHQLRAKTVLVTDTSLGAMVWQSTFLPPLADPS